MSDADTTRARIISAAGAVFAQKGFEAATVREICQLAQANLAAINYHFGDKHHLYIEAVKRAHAWKVQQSPLPDWPAGTPPQSKLGDFVRTLLTRMLSEDGATWHSQLMLREMSRPDSACQALVGDYIRPEFQLLLGILADLVPEEMPLAQRHLIAFSVVGQCLHYRVAQPVMRMLVPEEESCRFTPEYLARHITALTLAAVGVSPTLDQLRTVDPAPAIAAPLVQLAPGSKEHAA